MLAGAALLAPAADAADGGGSLWYYDSTGIAEAQQSTTGAGVHIAMLDGLINPSVPDLASANISVREPSYCADRQGGPVRPAADTSELAQHATSTAALIVGTGAGFPGDPGIKGIAPGAQLTVYAQRADVTCPASSPDGGGGPQAFRDAIADGADIIVVPGTTTVPPLDLAPAIRAGVVVIGAGGNTGGRVSGQPAVHNGVIATGTTGPDGSVAGGSAWGEELGLLAPGTAVRAIDPTFSFYGTTNGSSNSSVITAGVIALAMSAHPEATSNQILQAVVRTTDGSTHEPTRDDTRGYGALDVPGLMATDPTTLPDTNPFIRTDADASPSAEELGLVTETTTAPTVEPTQPAADAAGQDLRDEPEDGPDVLITGVATLGGITLVAATVATVVVLRRRRDAGRGPEQGDRPSA